MAVKFKDKINISLHESENLIHRSFDIGIFFNYSVLHIIVPLSL
jgi:hypothetical protein